MEIILEQNTSTKQDSTRIYHYSHYRMTHPRI